MPALLTRDPGLRALLEVARRAAGTQASVLLTGETGTGKNHLARFLHEHSPRASGPFMEVPCANLPQELLESELFGHERGAFTDAHTERAGRFEQAHGGTLYLDEIQELAPPVQAKVLRAVEQRRFERLGGTATLEVDVRIVVSTREPLELLLAAGRLREDLYYRMNVVRLHLPPLRERPADIPLLAEAFLEEAVAAHGLPPRRLSGEALSALRGYDWPGNVRELRHAVESAAVLAAGESVSVADLPPQLSAATAGRLRAAAAAGTTLAELERTYIDEVLRRTRGNKSAAARILGIHRKTLHEKLRARGGNRVA
ncbi:MAG TPA: sigma-54 dependent transcriptional regulator [Candidatus Polarisedimenticolaceae bacterium]|nr:sigma-54 dependent transcriptional regulator [Candidatus Polarisedimenticolaceae bacterium]